MATDKQTAANRINETEILTRAQSDSSRYRFQASKMLETIAA